MPLGNSSLWTIFVSLAVAKIGVVSEHSRLPKHHQGGSKYASFLADAEFLSSMLSSTIHSESHWTRIGLERTTNFAVKWDYPWNLWFLI
jgi:hypothetical protein